MLAKTQQIWQWNQVRNRESAKQAAALLGFFLMQAAFAAYVLAVWRLCADLEITGKFFIAAGLFSRWQVWLAVAVALQITASSVNRSMRQDESSLS